MRAPIRWAGSKRKMLPDLNRYCRGYKRHVEAFAGSASLFFHTEPEDALLNDLNKDLITAYSVLRTNPRETYEELVAIPVSREKYYELRSLDPDSLGIRERAIRFFYLNRYCFNGIYRTNSAGKFNVPFAESGKTGAFPPLSDWLACASQLRNATLSNRDFGEFLGDQVRRGDFVYIDPPYAVSNRRIFSQYSSQTFGLDDIERLSSLLGEIDRRGAVFLVSYAKSPESRILERDWYTRCTMTHRNVAGFSKHRRRAAEIMISNVPLIAAPIP